MTDTKAIPALIPYPLDLAETKNNALALADIPHRLAAGQAWAQGYLSGAERLDAATPNPAPRSPMSGRRGHTHAGKLDGRPLRRTLFSLSCDPGNVRGTGISENGHLAVAGFSNMVISDVQEIPLIGPFPVKVPGCDPDGGAYQDLGVRLCYAVKLNTNVVTADRMRIRIDNLTPGGWGCQFDETGLTGSPTFYVYEGSATRGTDTIRTVPGRINWLKISAEFTCAPSAGTRTISIELLECEGGVFED